MTGRKNYLRVLFLFLAIAGCSKITDKSQVVGVYEARHSIGIERLELRLDGTYFYEFRPSSGMAIKYSGVWRLDPYGGEPKVFLDNFSSHFPDAPDSGPIGTLLGVERRWGQMRLYLSYDRDEYYTRKSEG